MPEWCPIHQHYKVCKHNTICECGRIDTDDYHALDCPNHPFAKMPGWIEAVKKSMEHERKNNEFPPV